MSNETNLEALHGEQEYLYSSAQLLYDAWQLSRNRGGADDDKLTGVLSEARVDLNPHQVMAALFAFQSPFSKGVILADEVGLGKTIEAGIVISQFWAERKRRASHHSSVSQSQQSSPNRPAPANIVKDSHAGSKDTNREYEVGNGMNVNDVDDEQSQQSKWRR